MELILTEPKWADIEHGCNYIANRITELNLDIQYIVGITRGGLIPAVVMSHILKIPTVTVSYSSGSGKGNNKYYNNILPDIQSTINQNRIIANPPTILIVDDICDSGETLNDISSEYFDRGHDVFTATLYYKKGGVYSPHFYWQQIPKESGWITFPWEE